MPGQRAADADVWEVAPAASEEAQLPSAKAVDRVAACGPLRAKATSWARRDVIATIPAEERRA
ncbi:MAG: hypothetical protein R3A52_22935 [Polyangiales bacterium]